MSAPTPLTFEWRPAALEDIKKFKPADFGGVDPKTFHEQKVTQYHKDTASVSQADKARIRRGAHAGGTDPNEADHITVSFKKGKVELTGGGVHVYTGR